MARIESLEALRTIYRAPSETVIAKQLDRLDPHCKAFIALSPFCVLATQGADGIGDATPRGDAPGFVAVLDDRTIALPCRRVTSCAFGGPRLDVLYVTTARIGLDETTLAAEPHAGGLFAVAPGVCGTLVGQFGASDAK